jgi:hyperosmotically inducible periplasmic protein
MRYTQLILTTVLGLGGIACYGQATATSPQPENTKVNRSDRSTGAPTADQQKLNAADTKLTKTIRQSIMADKSLSSYAHNVKIISQNGVVTLKGPVKSEDEKRVIVEKAAAAAGGADKVTDQISVKH